MFGIAGVITTGVGIGVGAYSADKAGDKADKANKQANALSRETLAFSREQYEDWQRIYGPVQQRLRNYNMSLNPSDFAATGVNELAQNYQQVVENFDKTVAQRNIDSPASESIKAQMALDFARGKAEIRQQAPLAVAQQQQSFLSNQAVNPATGGVINALTNQQQNALNTANTQTNLSYQAGMGAGQALTSGLSAYFDNKAYNDRMAQLSAVPKTEG